ncbi:MAG: hypothetical protein OHK0029_16470 [Armatimonadaceae bacterium]
MVITLEVPPEVEGELQKIAKAQGKDVSAFLLEAIQRQLRTDILSDTEANLLQKINTPIAPEARQQRDSLLRIQEQRPLTGDEQAELTTLIDAVELANAARWQALADLAHLRGKSLSDIAQDLQIPLP